MPVYRYLKDCIEPVSPTSFQSAGVKERDDLQRLPRDGIDIVSPDTLIISEELRVRRLGRQSPPYRSVGCA